MTQSAVQVLGELHARLDVHFRGLHEAREELSAAAPVFGLEHGLDAGELDVLRAAVQSGVRQGFRADVRRWWLPFVVYAAESGYEYSGGEYWQTFEESTPQWRENGDRERIRGFFLRFADEYGGARPQGAFAEHFTIIAWPITHAVLPLDMQRNLARLLFEFRRALTAPLLQDPTALGVRLAGRAGAYTERFRLFCQNTALLGQVSVALLSGDEGDSPYLAGPTLHRLVDGLSRERETREWLRAARRSAGLVTRTSGLVPPPRPQPPNARPGRAGRPERLSALTDPRLLLRRAGGGWRAYAELPDLSPLITRFPHLADEFRAHRPRVAGAERTFLARGQLLFPGRDAPLARWPQPEEPFISLERGTGPVNALLAEQCVITPGPPWLFRRLASGLAVEVKGKTVRPGSSYVLVTAGVAWVPGFPWVKGAEIEADGVRAFEVDVPPSLREADIAALRRTGVSVASDVTVRPAGVVASNWDGAGCVEWLAGEPGMIAVSAGQTPEACVVTVDGERTTIGWPGGQRELLLRLDELRVGTHEARVELLAENGKAIAEGALVVTVRDPQVRPDSATVGEGIRMLADPAQPALSDLWDGRATISADGPPGEEAALRVTLLSEKGAQLAEVTKNVTLPVTRGDWDRAAEMIREDRHFRLAYDDAQSARITVSRAGIGFASVTADRGFQPLRWRVTRRHDGSHAARLIDRTDGTRTRADLYRVTEPLTAVPCDLDDGIAVPALGGVLRASAGEAVSAVLLPTQPTEVFRTGVARPTVITRARSAEEVTRLASAYHLWHAAERHADPFAARQQAAVLAAIARAIASLVACGRWGALEQRMSTARDLTDYLGEMARLIGESAAEKAIAKSIASRLWAWSDLDTLRADLEKIMAPTVRDTTSNVISFAVTLASRPDRIITRLGPEVRDELLRKLLAAPVLMRAARFAVLGANAFHGPESVPVGDR